MTAAVGRADALRARASPWVILEEFLAAPELDALVRFALGKAPCFRASMVRSHDDRSIVDRNSRRSQNLFGLGVFQGLFRERVLHHLPFVLARLGLPAFQVADVEIQLTVTEDGGFFRPHFDVDDAGTVGRRLTFVYFFFREPRRFLGGDLRLFERRARQTATTAGHEPRGEAAAGAEPAPAGWCVPPGMNQAIFFEADRLHEILPVTCPSRDLRDGRFTVNGWIHARKAVQ